MLYTCVWKSAIWHFDEGSQYFLVPPHSTTQYPTPTAPMSSCCLRRAKPRGMYMLVAIVLKRCEIVRRLMADRCDSGNVPFSYKKHGIRQCTVSIILVAYPHCHCFVSLHMYVLAGPTHTQRNKPWLHLTVFHQMALLQIAFLDLKRAFVMPVTLQCEPLSYNFGAFRQCSCVWLPGLLYDLWSLHFRSLTLLNFDFLQRSGSCL